MEIIDILYEKITKYDLNEWFLAENKDRKYNIYSSIDLRHSGYKIAPVDVNLFPGGFNNLTEESLNLAASIVKKSYQNKKFLIIPENHSRNLYYNDNLKAFQKILEISGNEAIIAHDQEIFSTTGEVIVTSSITKKDNLLITENGYVPDIILLNNDMIGGIPEILLDLEQEIIPHPYLGWFKRSKSCYFDIYTDVAEKFSRDFSLDSWLISTFTNICKDINFSKKEGLECIALNVWAMLKKIQNKYTKYSIKEKPYVFIKADNGSYGMGVTSVFTAEEVFNLNKNIRKNMNVTKGKSVINQVLLQEGIATINSYEGSVAEHLIYCIMDKPVSFLYRYHKHQSNLNNLNKVGAQFKEIKHTDKFNLVASLLSSLALLATSIELEHYSES